MAMTNNAEAQPMMAINTTPLIDVMLVLLIMFIITIPMQTHSVKVDLPAAGTPPELRLLSNEVAIDNSNIVRWNGRPVQPIVLRQYLDQTQRMDPIPELHVRAAPAARYEAVDNVLALAKRAHVTRMGFVGNEALASF